MTPQYQLTHEQFVYRFDNRVRTTIPTFEPEDMANTNPDFLAYKEWLAAGNKPKPADPVTQPVPREVPRWAGRLALKRHVIVDGELVLLSPEDDRPDDNLLARTYAMRHDLPAGELVDRIDAALDDAKDWLRGNQVLMQIAVALELTDEQVDQLFRWAGEQK